MNNSLGADRARSMLDKQIAAMAPRPTQIGNAASLLQRHFDPIQWLVPGIMPEGLMILAARPKIGKSWLALQLAHACATDGMFMGRQVSPGRVLFLGLEDSDRRLHSRLQKFVKPGDDLSLLDYATEWPRGIEGAAAISDWVKQHDDARLIVIDVLAKMRERVDGGESAYTRDYDDIAMLKAATNGRPITTLLVHHQRKSGAEDALDSISGTLGIAGAADGAWILRRGRGEDEAELHLIGRDLEDEGEFAIRFNRPTCHWEWVGDAWQVQIGKERRVILELLSTSGAMTPAEIAKSLNLNGDAIRQTLGRMKDAGQVDAGLDRKYRAIKPAATSIGSHVGHESHSSHANRKNQ